MCCAADVARAWVYPEHRDIALLAVQSVDPARQATSDRLRQEARAGDEARLCPEGADGTQGLVPDCIDWAALPAIAGDHSCSSGQLLDTALDAEWILRVADIAAQLKSDLAGIPIVPPPRREGGESTALTGERSKLDNEKYRADRLNALRVADTRLQKADPEYALRADTNLARFLLPRPAAGGSPRVSNRRYL